MALGAPAATVGFGVGFRLGEAVVGPGVGEQGGSRGGRVLGEEDEPGQEAEGRKRGRGEGCLHEGD